MSERGIIFDIKEMAVHDGPGPRTTVFLKGCPLRCKWCHNPEGLSFQPQLMVRESQCVHCGRCFLPCKHPDCQPYGRCLHACPKGLVSVSGTTVDSDALATRLLRSRDFWEMCGGGVTVSGGEPLAQPRFLLALLDALSGVHRCVETSGYAQTDVFSAVCARTELIIMDIKLADPLQHLQWTGCSNDLILQNLAYLRESGHPCIIRTPLIPQVTDTAENLSAIARLLCGLPGLLRAELLPYNDLAGAKYPMVGLTPPDFVGKPPTEASLQPFAAYGVPAVLA